MRRPILGGRDRPQPGKYCLGGAIPTCQTAVGQDFASDLRGKCERAPTRRATSDRLRDLILDRLAELEAHEQARRSVEERYLAGRSALFPDDAAAWVEQGRTSERIGQLAVALAEKDGLPIPERPEPEAVTARVAQLVADLVEPARVAALEQLGDGWRALGIATSWVRGKLGEPS